MWKALVVLALVEASLAGFFDFTEFDDPYGNLFFNRPGTLVRQHHGRCTTTDNTVQDGICLPRPECTFTGGKPQGAQSCLLGTCCVYSRGCDAVTSKRVSYFEGTTTNNNAVCTYTVHVENNNVCQMRLDFDSLNFPAPRRDSLPDGNGGVTPTGPYTCKDAFFEVQSPNNNGRIPILCGNNNGQHIYVPVNASRGERDLVIKIVNQNANINNNINNNNGNSVSWKIKVTQLECPSPYKNQKPYRVWEDSFSIAPAGCLQYYTAPSGTIRNLAFDPSTTTLATNHYQALLDYAVCFKRSSDMCGMDYNVDYFRLSGMFDPAAVSPNYCTAMTATGAVVDTDFLYVPNGVVTVAGVPPPPVYRDRLCGLIPMNSRIRSVTPGPFYIFFKTDNQVLDEIPGPPITDPENGWQLTYNTLYGNCGSIV